MAADAADGPAIGTSPTEVALAPNCLRNGEPLCFDFSRLPKLKQITEAGMNAELRSGIAEAVITLPSSVKLNFPSPAEPLDIYQHDSVICVGGQQLSVYLFRSRQKLQMRGAVVRQPGSQSLLVVYLDPEFEGGQVSRTFSQVQGTTLLRKVYAYEPATTGDPFEQTSPLDEISLGN